MTDLDSRPTTTSSVDRPRDRRSLRPRPLSPCQRDPHAFDLDVPDLGAWHYALAACHDCPIFTQCSVLLKEERERRGPHGLIWAGAAFDDFGREMTTTDLRRHYAKVRQPSTSRGRVVAVERSA